MAGVGESGKQAPNFVHNRLVFNRRVDVLSAHRADAVPEGGSMLD